MPPYHVLIGTNLIIYLNIIADSDDALGNAIDNVLAQIDAQWGVIAAANGLTFTVALPPAALASIMSWPNTINVIGAAPPAGVSAFQLTTGLGANAAPLTRSARISYVTYTTGVGYIYQFPLVQPPTFVPAVSHELGHVFGLSDRYYEAIYWLRDWEITRTRAEIRAGDYGPPPFSVKDGQTDPLPVTEQPRLAVRVSLPMSGIMVTTEGQLGQGVDPNPYDPYDNLMSSGTATLSTYQMNLIRNGQAEPAYRLNNWVAILGEWRRNGPPPPASLIRPINDPNNLPPGTITSKGAAGLAGPDYPSANNYTNDVCAWLFPAWESNPQQRPLDDGTGLLFLPVGDTTPKHYPCMRRLGRARTGTGAVFQPNTIATMMSKRRVVRPDGSHTANVLIDAHPDWMFYARRMLRDLVRI